MDGGLYKDNKGRYYVDCNTAIEHGKQGSVYMLSPSKEIDGEPNRCFTGIICFTNPPSEREEREKLYRMDYMMLDRHRADCEYYDTAEHYNHAHGQTIADTIESMKERWQRIPADLKPEWLSWDKILEYEKKFNLA